MIKFWKPLYTGYGVIYGLGCTTSYWLVLGDEK